MNALGWLAVSLIGTTLAFSALAMYEMFTAKPEPVDVTVDEHFDDLPDFVHDIVAIHNLEESFRLPAFERESCAPATSGKRSSTRPHSGPGVRNNPSTYRSPGTSPLQPWFSQ